MTPLEIVVLTITFCIADAPTECQAFDFAPPYPITKEQCQQVAPVVVPQIAAPIPNAERLTVKEFRCRDLSKRDA